MPFLSIQTNQDLNADTLSELLTRASRTVAEILAKPERYVMVSVAQNDAMLFAQSDVPLAYLELKSIDLPEESTRDLSQALCRLVHELLAVDMDRVYVEFSNPPRHMWGWNGGTF
jgi:phenylpyruvate tautomerase